MRHLLMSHIISSPPSSICDCGKPYAAHAWLTTFEYEEGFKPYCVRNEGLYWVVVPEGWEPSSPMDKQEREEKTPDDPCDSDYMEDIST
jgi:hypothetical protein